MIDYVALPLIGAMVSIVVQYVKSTGEKGPTWLTLAMLILLSLLGGAFYHVFNGTAVWNGALQILLYANAVYGFIISRYE